jgi:hypothetical protein
MKLLGAAKNNPCSQPIWSVRKAVTRVMCSRRAAQTSTRRRPNAADHLIYTELWCNIPSVLTIVPASPR